MSSARSNKAAGVFDPASAYVAPVALVGAASYPDAMPPPPATPAATSAPHALKADEKARRTLFVRSGGGLPGIDIHVGITAALRELGVESHANTGTSAGAAVAAMDSAGWSVGLMADLVSPLERRDVLRRRYRRYLLAGLFRVRHWFDVEPLDQLLQDQLPSSFAMFTKPLAVWATDAETNRGRFFAEGRTAPAVLASMSIPGLLPYVSIGDRLYTDGGVSDNLPLPPDWTDYGEVWLLVASTTSDFAKRSENVVARVLSVAEALMQNQLSRTIAGARQTVDAMIASGSRAPRLRVVRPNVQPGRGLLRWDHELQTIAGAEAYRQAKAQIETDKRQPKPRPAR